MQFKTVFRTFIMSLRWGTLNRMLRGRFYTIVVEQSRVTKPYVHENQRRKVV